MNKTIVTVTGLSCSGKTTLTKTLCHSSDFVELVSTTTRSIRKGEVNGRDYHFVTHEEFDKNQMLEYTFYGNNFYGVSEKEIEEKFQTGKTPIIIVDPHGLAELCKAGGKRKWKVVNIFVNCTQELQFKRLFERYSVEYKTILASGDMNEYDRLLENYKNRLMSIVNTEKDWEAKFRFLSTNDYYYISYLDADNQQKHMNHIKNMV